MVVRPSIYHKNVQIVVDWSDVGRLSHVVVPSLERNSKALSLPLLPTTTSDKDAKNKINRRYVSLSISYTSVNN